MDVHKGAARTRVTLSAVLAKLRMPAGQLAALAAGDRIEVEPEPGAEPVVRLMVGGATVAVASVEEHDGRLIATISRIGNRSAVRNLEQWQFRKNAKIPG
jgi:flagellar motor switch/type III secretory pathway protein FliN